MLWKEEGVFPNASILFCYGKGCFKCWGLLYYIRLLELGKPRCVKEGKSSGKGFLALNFCFAFNS